jgi:hypothetical protein
MKVSSTRLLSSQAIYCQVQLHARASFNWQLIDWQQIINFSESFLYQRLEAITIFL